MNSEAPQGWRLLCTTSGQPLYYPVSENPLLPAPSSTPPGSANQLIPSSTQAPGTQLVPLASPAPVNQFVSRGAVAAPRSRDTQLVPLASRAPANQFVSGGTVAAPRSRSRELPPPSRYILPTLVENTRAKAKGFPVFEVERDRVLQINLGGSHESFAWIKAGTVIARRGNVKFTRQGLREQGAGILAKKAVTGEGVKLVQCKGSGTVYCADEAKAVSVIELRKQTLFVNSPNVLGLSSSLKHDFKLLSNAGMVASGLFCLKVSGLGFLAITSLKGAIMMSATPEDPVYSKADATVAWTHQPSFTLDLSRRLLTGRTTGQEFQLKFTHGFVIIQPLPKHLSMLSDRAAALSAGSITLALSNLYPK